MKIVKIEVQNYKAIAEQSIELNGCSVIVTAGNNKGKTSMLRGVVDRMRGFKPSIIVKEGEEKGMSTIELSDGSKINWNFTEKSEKFEYITKEGFKVTSGVIKTIGKKYFGSSFDIDKFIASSEKEQFNTIGKILGVDLDALNESYKEAYDNRTQANRDLKHVANKKLIEPEKVEKPELNGIDQKIEDEEQELKKRRIEAQNDYHKKLEEYNLQYDKAYREIVNYNKEQEFKDEQKLKLREELEMLKNVSPEFEDCIDYKKASLKVDNLPKPEPYKSIESISIEKPIFDYTPDETGINQLRIEREEFSKKEAAYTIFEKDMKDYADWLSEVKRLGDIAEKYDDDVKALEEERKSVIADANLPTEFTLSEGVLLYNGLPLTNEQQSSSAKYIAALKLNMLCLGDVKAMHFDASFLDKISLGEIEEWASQHDLQLLIERPDFEGGEITYQLLEQK